LHGAGMDQAIDEQPLQRHLRHLAPDRVETGHDHRIRYVVDDQIDTGELLQRPDVAALPADDPTFHVVARELDYRDSRFGGVLGGVSLDREKDDVASLLVSLLACLLLEQAHAPVELLTELLFKAAEELLPCLLG